jgi:nucleotide-binding universal stress UspA family protein
VYEKILLAHDGTERARLALPHLLRLAGRETAVILCHVVDGDTAPAAPAEGDPLPRATGVAFNVALESMRAELTEAGFASVETMVLEGPPAETLARAALELGADLVVVSARKQGGVRRALLGSVTDYLVRNTEHAAVLVVAPPDAD